MVMHECQIAKEIIKSNNTSVFEDTKEKFEVFETIIDHHLKDRKLFKNTNVFSKLNNFVKINKPNLLKMPEICSENHINMKRGGSRTFK